jgi:hypothetical protein
MTDDEYAERLGAALTVSAALDASKYTQAAKEVTDANVRMVDSEGKVQGSIEVTQRKLNESPARLSGSRDRSIRFT